jgi:hypothetical protein
MSRASGKTPKSHLALMRLGFQNCLRNMPANESTRYNGTTSMPRYGRTRVKVGAIVPDGYGVSPYRDSRGRSGVYTPWRSARSGPILNREPQADIE